MNYNLGLYEKSMPSSLSWKEKFAIAKDSGYDFLEMSIDETDEKLARLSLSSHDRKKIVDTMFSENFKIRSICLSGHRRYPMGSKNSETRGKSIDIIRSAIDLASDLGIKIIQLAGYDVYYEDSDSDTIKYFYDSLQLAVEMAASKSVILGFETMETEFMNTIKKTMEYVNRINSPYLGIYPDCGNLTNAALSNKNSVENDLMAGKGHVFAMHLKETLPGKFREIPFGDGHVDFRTVIKTAWNIGVRTYTAEFWYVNNSNWKEILHYNNKFLRDFFTDINIS